jgi:hypothetical protein
MHIGGKPRLHHESNIGHEDTYEWYPPDINLPRFFTLPLSFVLAGRIILANYFPSFYHRLRDDEQWMSVMTGSESVLWKPFFEHCLAIFRNLDMRNTFYDRHCF